jgi:hypothetical protein
MKFEKGSSAETRRKLVRGSVVAPLVMTLRPGVAAAASITCWEKAPETTSAALLTGNPDSLVRIQVQIYSVVVGANAIQQQGSRRYGSGSSGAGNLGRINANPQQANQQAGTWRCYLKDGFYYTTSQQSGGPPHDNSLPADTLIIGGNATPREVEYRLAYVDSSGKIVASAPTAQPLGTTKPLATSCWSSIATIVR